MPRIRRSSQRVTENLSSNSLFHFTSSMDKLISILSEEFEPRICFEYYGKKKPDQKTQLEGRAFPMVCFCDIPLSKTKKHAEFYGRYAIGMSKDWGIRKGVCPVMYTPNRAPLLESIRSIISTHNAAIANKTSVRQSEFHMHQQTFWSTLRIFMQVKPYEGYMERNGEWKGPIRFYDEREWRFVPDLREGWESRGWKILLTYEDFKNNVREERLPKEVIQNQKLSFTPSQIRYIIVEKEREILTMCQLIDEIKAKYSDDERTILKTRILSFERISEDF